MVEASAKDLDAPYWTALEGGRLALPRCASCARWHWPAVARCGDCGEWGLTWQAVPMEGTVFSWTRTWHPFGGTEGLETPFVTVVVAITGAGERRLMGLLEGVPDGQDVATGAPVVGRVTRTRYGGDDIPTITWRFAD